MSTKHILLRILSYNIHKGFSPGGRKFVLQGIREAIQLVHADIVFLQEVIGVHAGHQEKVDDWPDSTQFEYLADTVWEHYAYGQNAVYEAGHHGNAILSKYPIIAHSNTDISPSRLEQRGILHATIEVPDSSIRMKCYCTHLGLMSRDRKRQIVKLCKLVKKSALPEEPVIIAGDFNDWTRRLTSRMFKHIEVEEVFKVQYGRHARTFPSGFPILALDRIYCRNLAVADAEVLTGSPWNRLSDHAALYAELKFPVK